MKTKMEMSTRNGTGMFLYSNCCGFTVITTSFVRVRSLNITVSPFFELQTLISKLN